MVLRKALAVLAVVLVLALNPQDLAAADAAAGSPDPAGAAFTKEVEDAGVIVSVVGTIIGTSLAFAGFGGANVEIGDINIAVDNTHFHVGDERQVVVEFPFCNGNMNVWDTYPGQLSATIIVDDEPSTDSEWLWDAVQGLRHIPFMIEGHDDDSTEIVVKVSVLGEDLGILWDAKVEREGMKTAFVGVQSPLGPLALTPPGGETFDHGIGVTHTMTLENHGARHVWVLQPYVNGVTDIFSIALPGQDYGPPATTALIWGAVNHTATHTMQTVPVGFQWGCSKYKMHTSRRVWEQDSNLDNGTDFCLQKGDQTAIADPVEPKALHGSRDSSGCFQPGFIQLSNVSHNFGLAGITVSIVNYPGVGPVHDLVTDATGRFCWTSLNLAETVNVTLNSDGNVPELEQTTFEQVPLSALENNDPALEMNFVEWLVPPIGGVLETSDGGDLFAQVYSRRPGFPDHPIGFVADGAFSLEGHQMLKFNSFNSELVFVPIPPFNRTLSPATEVVVPFDPTYIDGVDIGTVNFNISPRDNSPSITLMGTFMDDAMQPIPGLEFEFHNGPSLITSATTGGSGHLDVTLPNGVATVSVTNFGAFDLEPLEAEDVDFGLNGSSVLDVGDRMLFRRQTIFVDGFESGDTSAWGTVNP